MAFAVHQPASFKSPEALEILRSLALDALVVVAYGLILPPAALGCPKLGCINIHASLLPRWRGAAPIQRALLAGDAQDRRHHHAHGRGPRYRSHACGASHGHRRRRYRQERCTTGLRELGAELIVETLAALDSGRIREEPQPSAGVTYAAKITKAEALDRLAEDAAQIWRRVRAFNPWPIAETRLDGAQLRIWDAELRDSDLRAGGAPGTRTRHGARRRG